MQKAYKLHGKHRHYDWGGCDFIPQLMSIANPDKKPFAEYWMGAHASAPAIIATNNEAQFLDQLIADQPSIFLGEKVLQQFSSLPYLYKILDVANMLSIQVHPSKENAAIGFAQETSLGIALDAPNRNYKDQNHKPEVMVALSEFWLLHGFLAPTLLEARLQEYFPSLLDHFKGSNYQGLYQYFMHLTNEEVDIILKPILKEAMTLVKNGEVDKSHPHWWANKYYGGVVPEKNIDKGIFSIYILNIVHVKPYEGVFQGAGLLHAYLEGQNIELMANSDNVLRGGLTPKHIDIKELLKHVHFVPTYPNVLKGDAKNDIETLYPCPVPDFGLTKIVLKSGESYTITSHSLEMILVIKGMLTIDHLVLKAGEVAMVLPGQTVKLEAQQDVLAFKSFVP
ncbi:MAG: mannose-6-phosphate isomerase, class I [Chitinophagia bacterium]|jgi:mannose-6-phosphate isomerase|nr:mannose-6-phosphate isomerase, class I [Chitinophagia bacterium]